MIQTFESTFELLDDIQSSILLLVIFFQRLFCSYIILNENIQK